MEKRVKSDTNGATSIIITGAVFCTLALGATAFGGWLLYTFLQTRTLAYLLSGLLVSLCGVAMTLFIICCTLVARRSKR